MKKCLQFLFGGLVKKTEQQVPSKKINTLDDLLKAFTEGFEPNLSIPEQRHAFEAYRKLRFGNPNTPLVQDTLDQVAKAIKQHPKLRKEPFRSFRIETQDRIYPVTEGLSAFLNPQVRSAAQVRANLFQVDANRGYWKKIFQYEEPASFKVAIADKVANKALAKEAQAHFDEFLFSRISKETREMLADVQVPVKERTRKLYDLLMQERTKLKAAAKDTRPISQAIVDLIHNVGYHDPVVVMRLKSADGLDRLEAFRKVLEERDTFAMELGYEKHFDQVLRDFNIQEPTGVAKGVQEKLLALENEIMMNAKEVKNSNSTKTVRHLSLTESPFRSCLGGSDCSSRTYLTRALDPNYHYFTLTNEQGFSTGHITVVLGEARSAGKKTKVAFVDKVQNVDNVDMPAMMEGVRRSLEEKGYTLALPVELGQLNGISNEAMTRLFIERSIKVDQNHLMTSFTPHSHSYHFRNAFSRADDRLSVRTVLPLKQPKGIEILPGETQPAWRASADFNLKTLLQESIQLKHGGVEDKIRYISSMKVMEKAGLKGDPEFTKTIEAWLGDASSPLKLKKQILLTEWTESKKPLSKLLDHFNPNDQKTLIQNFLDTPRYRKMITDAPEELLALINQMREHKKIRDMLVAEYSPNFREPIARILDAGDVNSERAINAIRQIGLSFTSPEVADVVKIQRFLSGTSVEPWLESQMVSNYMKNVHSNTVLQRELLAVVDSADPAMRHFGSLLLNQSLERDARHFPLIQSYREILNVRKVEGSSFFEAAESWLKKPEVTPALKAEFVMTQMGSSQRHRKPSFMGLMEVVPNAQRPEIWARIERETNLLVFRTMAEKHGLESILFERGALESFQFRPIVTEKQVKNGGVKVIVGKGDHAREMILTQPFEMQATPFTQLEALIATGKNQSRFVEDGFEVTVNGRTVKIDPNRPAEQYSMEDQQAILDLMNANDPKWYYRRPTEAEWEYAARGGAEHSYQLGERDEDMLLFSWGRENSGYKTQPVAGLRANSFGLYDMHGNVWEFMEDYTVHSLIKQCGGSHVCAQEYIRNGGRQAVKVSDRYHDQGFRLVRTPK